MYRSLRIAMLCVVLCVPSCGIDAPLRPDAAGTAREELSLQAGCSGAADGTRSVSTDGLMPEDYVIYTSAYLVDTDEPENTGNYITACEFRHRSGNVWASSPKTYWPLDGTLSFLAVATDPSALPLDGRLSFKERNTDGVTVSVPDNDGSTEILYAREFPASNSHSVPEKLTFRHTQACISFRIKAEEKGVVRLKDIVLDDVCMSGILHIDARSLLPSKEVIWEYDRSAGRKLSVPGIPSAGMELNDTDWHVLNVALLSQKQQNFEFSFEQRAYDGGDWSAASPFTVDYDGASGEWEMGKRYIYNLFISVKNKVVFSLSVEDMEDAGETEVYPSVVLE